MDHQLEEEGRNSRVDLLSSLFGQQIAAGIILNNHSNTNGDEEDQIQRCEHPVYIGNSCTNCGEEHDGTTSTTPFWYIYPYLNLSLKEVNRIRDANLQTLLTRKKLHLVLDLDHTLVHTRKLYKLSPEDRRFLRSKKYGIDYSFPGELGSCDLYKMNDAWTKLRPYVGAFLREASTMFDMTVYTLGCQSYAWSTAKLLDPEGVYFDNWRVVSREDCASLDKHKKVLDVVLEHERVVVVMDDNEHVWEDHKGNLLRVIPYNFFSYSSPEGKDRDASPPRESWSQLNGDESEENGVLAKALDKLRAIHAAFFDDSRGGDCVSRDVRQGIQEVLTTQKLLSKKQKKQKGMKMNGLSRALQAVQL